MTIPQPPAPGARRGAPSGGRSRALLTATWLVATVLAAAIAWWAMTAVGGERRADGTGLVSQARVEELLAARGLDATDPTPGVSPTPSAGSTPWPDPTASPDAGVHTGTDATAPPPAGGGPGGAPPATTEVARTWDVTGGQVGAVCTGATIALLYATPADGWTVEVERAGPAELEVDFSRADADARVRAECVGGTPEITRSEGPGDGGGDDGGGDDRGGDGGGGDDGGGDDRGGGDSGGDDSGRDD